MLYKNIKKIYLKRKKGLQVPGNKWKNELQEHAETQRKLLQITEFLESENSVVLYFIIVDNCIHRIMPCLLFLRESRTDGSGQSPSVTLSIITNLEEEMVVRGWQKGGWSLLGRETACSLSKKWTAKTMRGESECKLYLALNIRVLLFY